MSFRSIRDQDSAVSFLKREAASGKTANAYIFLGLRGIGKTLTALNFAKALNCLSSAGAGEPCDACASCKKIDSSSHPDVFLLEPEERKASVGIDRIRELISNISLKAYEGRRKVYIVDEADSMKHEAANAVLKTLEEPPSESVIILITRNLNSIFRTIVSRSQVVRFFPLKGGTIKDILMSVHSVPAQAAEDLSRIASGSLGEALKLKDSSFAGKRAALIDVLVGRGFLDAFFEKVPKGDIKMYLDMMLSWYRDVLVAKSGAGSTDLVNADSAAVIAKEASRLDEGYLEEVINGIILTGLYMDQNANPKVAMSVLEERICTR